MKRVAIGLLIVGLGAGAAVCGDDTGSTSGSVTVAAASSLTEAFTEIGHDFEAAHPGAKLTFTFDASSALAEQITSGAPADVFASADESNMTKVVGAAAAAGTPEAFASNSLEIAAKPGNPNGVQNLADLADVGTVALCAPEVPCGKLAAQVLSDAGVTIPESHITRAEKVKGVVTAVAEGDAEAGIVYVTDIAAAGDSLTGVEIPASENASTGYPIVALAHVKESDVAAAFVAYVLSPAGQATLKSFGFSPA